MILEKTLEYLERQTIAERIEVIVVSDGKDDETKWGVENEEWRIDVRYFEVPKSQQGVARNKGVEEAKGERILFIGDDIFLEPDACEIHSKTINSPSPPEGGGGGGEGVLGFTTWDPACGITNVMRWLEKTGWQFGYPMLERYAHSPLPEDIQHRFTYTSHISLPTDVARRIRFRDDVTLYGWEDVEWGYRLMKENVPLVYEPDARALHHHHVSLEDSLKRIETLGRSAMVMERIAPQLRLVPRGFKRWKYALASFLPGLRGSHTRAFLLGIDFKKNPAAIDK